MLNMIIMWITITIYFDFSHVFFLSFFLSFLGFEDRMALRVEFLLKTDSGYPKDTAVNKPWQPLGIPSAITPIGQLHQSPPSPIPRDLGRGPSHQSTCSNIETRMERPKSVVSLFLSLRLEF